LKKTKYDRRSQHYGFTDEELDLIITYDTCLPEAGQIPHGAGGWAKGGR